MIRFFRNACWVLLAVTLGCNDAADDAGDYPNRPIKLIVPFSPGGGTDTFARIVKKAIEDQQLLDQPLVVVNVDGAGGTIGSRRVKNARPDGYTIMILHEAIVTARYSGQAPYGPEAFEPIAGTGTMGLVVAVRDDSRFTSLEDLMEEARAAPDSIVFSANLGAPVHFLGLMLEQQVPGARFRFTQSGGGTKRLHALKGGHAEVTAFSIEEFARYQEAGIRAIAYCDRKRHPVLPDVPTTYEQGLPVRSVNMQFWWAPQGTPAGRIDVLARALGAAMQTDQVRERMAAIHCDPVVVTGTDMAREIDERREAIVRIDTRRTQELPNLPAFILPLVCVFGAAVAVQSARARARRAPESTASGLAPPLRRRLAMFGVAATLVYVAALSLVDFRLLTFVYVVVVAGALAGWRKERALAVVVLAATLALGTHYLFTRVFDLVLP